MQQQVPSQWKPVAYASRAMSEKEALAIVWACTKFGDYVIGKTIRLETDHKPLVPLLSTTHLDRMPPRVLRFRLRLTRFDYMIEHVPGKLLYTADTLSRSPEISKIVPSEYPDMEFLVQALVAYLPTSDGGLQKYRKAQENDPICSQVLQYCKTGWPTRQEKGDLTAYWRVRGELSMCDSLLLNGTRIVVPKSLQSETLQKIHQGYQGIQKCKERVSTAVWWPGVSQEVEYSVKSCSDCMKTAVAPINSTGLSVGKGCHRFV